MKHTHPDRCHWPMLFGCDACRRRVERDQYVAELPHVTDQWLHEALMARDHIVGDWKREALLNEEARRATESRAAS